MNTMIIGLFHSRTDADGAVRDLHREGYSIEDLSIVMKDLASSGRVASQTSIKVKSGASSGAVTGGLIGGVAGLLTGIGAITIPGVGALFAAGPLLSALGWAGTAAASTVSGLIAGGAVGGVLGGLVGLGIPEKEARFYEKAIKTGSILLSVHTDSDHKETVSRIFQDHHADRVRTLNIP